MLLGTHLQLQFALTLGCVSGLAGAVVDLAVVDLVLGFSTFEAFSSTEVPLCGFSIVALLEALFAFSIAYHKVLYITFGAHRPWRS